MMHWNHWIRWNYVGPRLVAIGLVAAALHFGLPPLIRWSLTTSGERALAAKVEVGEVACAPLDTRLVLRDLAVVDRSNPWRDLMAADLVVLEVEPGSLARKRVTVRRGMVRGLQFGAPRSRSGELGEGEDSLLGRFAASAADRGRDWLRGYWMNLGAKLDEDLRQEFASLRLAEELASHWPKAYQKYYSRVQELLTRGRAIESKIREARKNPLRNLSELRQATQEVDRLNRDLGELVNELNALHPQLAADREAVWEAWQADREKLKEGLALDGIDGRAISDYLLQEEVAGHVGTMVRWIERVRAIVPGRTDLPEPERQRGTDIFFAGLDRRPEYLIRSLQLHGRGSVGGETFELTGTVIGLTTEPAHYGRPTIVKIAGRGAVRLDLEASLDRTGNVPTDHIVVKCPVIPRGPVELGLAESFSLALGEGRDELRAEMQLRQSQLDGTVVLTTHTKGLQLAAEPTQATRWSTSLDANLAGIRRIETTLHVTGPLEEPTLRMESTIGSQLIAAVQSATQQEVIARRQELEGSLEERIQSKLAETERLVEDHRREIEQRLTEQQTKLIRLAADTLGMGDRPTMHLGSSEGPRDRSANSRTSTFQR